MMCYTWKGINVFLSSSLLVFIGINSANGDVIINEFVASNSNVLDEDGVDENGDTSDWIEIHNNGGSPVSLANYSLTDDSSNFQKWMFPARSIPAGGYIVVFASGKDRSPVSGELHASFSLSKSGEYLALCNNGVPEPSSTFSQAYPEQREDFSYGSKTGESAFWYYESPTPGSANSGSTYLGFLPRVDFSPDRGIYSATFSVSMSSTEPGTTIRYTEDGSVPTAASDAYSSPLSISSTSILRAVAFKTDYLPSIVETNTYIFLADVYSQPDQPAGFPTSWHDRSDLEPVDYGMDQDVITDPDYAPYLNDAFTSIPTMSIVMEMDDLFTRNTGGIYPNSYDSDQKPASVELIHADGTKGFDINCGIRNHGAGSRDISENLKHSFRLLFKSEYGPTKLNYPFFEGSPVTQFDTLILRGGNNFAWNNHGHGGGDGDKREAAQCIRDIWARDTQLALGQPASRGNYVHLYLNGLYWGIYNASERPNAPFLSDHLGGEREDWDSINSSDGWDPENPSPDHHAAKVVDGDDVAWYAMMAIADGGLSSQSAYDSIQDYLDVENLIDYVIVQHYTQNTDWEESNWYVGRRSRLAPGVPNIGAGFKFFLWDAEYAFFDVNKNMVTEDWPFSPRRLYNKLRENPEFRLLFADHLHRHFFNGGPMTTEPCRQRWMDRANELYKPIIAESARWGDAEKNYIQQNPGDYWNNGDPYTRDDEWIAARDEIVNVFMGARSGILLNQYKNISPDPLYPGVDAPVFNIGGSDQHGGGISSGDSLTMSNPNGSGTIYYTLDGTDVRTPAGFSGTEVEYTGSITLTESTLVTARVLDGPAGDAANWSAANVATYSTGIVGAGTLVITELMYHPAVGGAEFVELKNTGADAIDLSGLTFSSGIAFTFPPNTVLPPGEFFILVRDDDVPAFAAMYPAVPIDGVYVGELDNAGETVEVSNPSGLVAVVSYDNAPPWPVTADGFGKSLVPVSHNPTGSQNDPAQWLASATVNGSPGADDAAVQTFAGILINEALTHTDDPLVDKIELYNPTASPVDMEGWHLTDDNNVPDKWTIPSGHEIPAFGYLVFQEGSGYSGGVLQIGSDNFGSAFSLSALGDEVYLLSPDYSYGHGFKFKGAYNGTSFGRVTTTGGEDFASQTATSFGSANPGPQIGPVVITEIMYHPDNDDPIPANHDHEFVEIKNISGGTVTLCDGVNPDSAWKINGLGFTFPPNTEMQSGDIIVVCKDTITPEEFRTNYGVPASVAIFNHTGKLENGGETVSLEAPDEPNGGEIPWVVIDKVKYDDAAPWPTGPGGPDGNGPSLERISESNYGNDASNWQQSESSGGTPGALTPIEAWRLTNFGSAADSGDGADLSDPDFDGVSNLLEYGLGRSPSSAAGSDGTAGLPEVTLAATHEDLVGRLTFVCDLPDPAPVDVSYAVEASSTMEGTWTVLASKTGAGAWVWQAGGPARIVETSDAGRTVVQVGDVELLSAQSRRFMRLRVSR